MVSVTNFLEVEKYMNTTTVAHKEQNIGETPEVSTTGGRSAEKKRGCLEGVKQHYSDHNILYIVLCCVIGVVLLGVGIALIVSNPIASLVCLVMSFVVLMTASGMNCDAVVRMMQEERENAQRIQKDAEAAMKTYRALRKNVQSANHVGENAATA